MAVKKKEEGEEKKGKSPLAALMDANKDDHLNNTEKVYWKCSTGSLRLDAATGMVSPGLWRLVGQNNGGKTPQALEIIRNMFIDVPNSKAVWCPAEGRDISEENRARCGLKFVTKLEEWEVGTVYMLLTNVYEFFIDFLKTAIINNEENVRYAFVVDSMDGLVLRKDRDREIDEANKVAGAPALTKKMMQALSLRMFHWGHLLIFISQVSAEIKLDQYSKTPDRGGNFGGGNSALHAADVIINYLPFFGGDFILDSTSGRFNDGKTKSIGKEVRVELSKVAKEASVKMKLTYPIRYGRKPSGVWVERELCDLMLGWDLALKSGAWINFAESILADIRGIAPEFPDKVQGLEKFYKLLEDNQNVVAFLRTEFLKRLS